MCQVGAVSHWIRCVGSVGQGGEEVEVEGGLEGGGRAQHDEVAVLGPDQLQADRAGRCSLMPTQTMAAGERVMLKG